MDNKKNNNVIFCPSFEFEKKTKAFNKYIWWFVSLISLFTIDLLIFVFFDSFMCYFLKLVSTFIQDNFLTFIILPIVIFILLSYQFYQFLTSLKISYKFEDGKIIKGTIQKTNKIKKSDLVIETASLINMANNINNASIVTNNMAILNLNNVLNLINFNTNPEFVKQYFDTDLYKKKIYENPQLIKTTKYSLIYLCDNNKKLIIPKIYDGICNTENLKESSFIGRIIKKSAIIFFIALIFSIFDLSIGFNSNNKYLDNISSEQKNLDQNFNYYGYKSLKINETLYKFEKELDDGDRISEVSYHLDKNGNIESVDIQLYYDYNSNNVESELEYIISTINDKFDGDEVVHFIDLVKENLAGNYQYGTLKSKNYKLILSRSNGYIDIHNY